MHIDQSHDARQTVLKTAGLIGFVSFRGMVVAVPPKQIEDLQLLLQEKGLFSLHAFVRTGQRVRDPGRQPARDWKACWCNTRRESW